MSDELSYDLQCNFTNLCHFCSVFNSILSLTCLHNLACFRSLALHCQLFHLFCFLCLCFFGLFGTLLFLCSLCASHTSLGDFIIDLEMTNKDSRKLRCRQ